MSDEKKPSRPGKRKVRMALELGADMSQLGSLEELLSRVVEAAGGQAGLMTTWDADHPDKSHTSSYGLDRDAARMLGALVQEAVPRPGRPVDPETADRLEQKALSFSDQAGLGPLHAIALPVRSQDRPVGLLCLLFTTDTPTLLRESPGVYNLLMEQVLDNARLLHRLLQERRWLEAVVRHNSDGVVIMDRDGLVIGFNEAMERLSQWALSDAVGRPSHEVFPLKIVGGQQSTVLTRLSQSQVNTTSTAPVEALLTTKGGGPIDVEMTGAALQDEQGKPLGWVMMLRDIRQRKEMERLQRIFLSALSHELQTPIAIIKGFSGLLSDTEVNLTPEQARAKAAVIHEESERLERMVKQMLEATRIQAGGIKLLLEPVNLADLVRRALQKMEPLAQARSVRLEMDLPRRLPLVMGDSDRLQQVITNLVENALKYSGDGTVRITATPEDGFVIVWVEDTGPGVPTSDRERIFELFERGSQSQTVRGAGLGLFICKAIVEAHGGRIGVSDADGGGSRFYFTIPAVPKETRSKS